VVAVSDRIIVLAAGRSAGHLGVEAFRSLALLQCMSPLLADFVAKVIDGFCAE
jgi:hypothetical protein